MRHIYTTDKACIKLGNSRSNLSDLSLDVRQGCVLSTLLFNNFLSDLCKKLQFSEVKMEIDSKTINSLFTHFLLSETDKGLKVLLKILEDFCDENKLTINTDKTKCMILNKLADF